MLVHRPKWALKKVVHRLDRSAFHLRETKVYEDHSGVRQQRVKKECTVAHLRDHCWSGSRDAVVDDPVHEEAEAIGASKWSSRNEGKVLLTDLIQNERCYPLVLICCSVEDVSDYLQFLRERSQPQRHNTLRSDRTTIRKHTSR